VYCLVLHPDHLTAGRGESAPPDGVVRVRGDLVDPADRPAVDRCAQCVKGQATIHMVGIITPRGRQTYARVHIEGTRVVVEAMKRAGVRRLIHVSALGAHPDGPTEYFRTKAAAEQIVRESGLDWTILRPSLVHGPDGEFMQLLARLARGFLPMPLLGPGEAKLQPIWVEDVARAVAIALDRPDTIGKSIDLVGPTVLTWNQLYDTVCAAVLGPGLDRPKAKVHIPVWLATMAAGVFRLLPVPGPFNRDQVLMAQLDNVADAGDMERYFGFRPADFAATLAGYLELLK
jgi:NADH dehydrogenase